MKKTIMIAMLGMVVAQSQASLVYVDAVDDVGGNTTLSDGSTLFATDLTGGATWRQRDNAQFGASGTVFEGVEPSPEIKTTITGLIPGQEYQVYVHFWDPTHNTTEAWAVQAGFTSGSLTTFSYLGDSEVAGSTSGVLASSLTYDVAPDVFGPFSNRENIAGLVGSAFADGGGNLEVFIDDLGTTDVNNRTWYDGVSYEAIPEPATIGLVGIFGAGVLFVRRNFRI